MMFDYIKYDTMKFCDIFNNADTFISEVKGSPLMYKTVNSEVVYLMSDKALINLYYLLYARYGNSPIANGDINQFKYKMFAIIFQYGPTWETKLNIQEAIRNLDIEDIKNGSTAIYNRALNPENDPTTQTTTELTYINEQNVNKQIKNDSAAYSEWWGLLRDDVSKYFIDRFKVCFKIVVMPEKPIIYVSEV